LAKRRIIQPPPPVPSIDPPPPPYIDDAFVTAYSNKLFEELVAGLGTLLGGSVGGVPSSFHTSLAMFLRTGVAGAMVSWVVPGDYVINGVHLHTTATYLLGFDPGTSENALFGMTGAQDKSIIACGSGTVLLTPFYRVNHGQILYLSASAQTAITLYLQAV
jgi:hypothetical protein